MHGDGNFKWWCGEGERPESYLGPFETRERAIDEGRGYWKCDFSICEADKPLIQPNFSAGFIAENIMSELQENNEECFGEDGPEDAWSHDNGARFALERALEMTVAEWLKAHPGRTWRIGSMRNEEYFPANDEGESA